MAPFSRMPRYDIRNDGAGPYAIFYCDMCGREFRSNPDIANTVTQDFGRQAMGGFLRKIPLVGSAAANTMSNNDPRYTYTMTPAQIDSAWRQVQVQFRECPTCSRIVCLSDFDAQSGFCREDSPRTSEMSETQGAQAGAAIKGFAAAFGLGDVVKKMGEAAKTAQTAAAAQSARCPKDGTLAPAGTKFCPECGSPMVQPVSSTCPNCGADTKGAKFCPECGTKMEQAPVKTVCPSCGAETQGARFCPECGTKLA